MHSVNQNAWSNNSVLVLIPSTLDSEESFIRNLVKEGILLGEQHTDHDSELPPGVKFIYYTWVVDCICADVVAPINDYIADFSK